MQSRAQSYPNQREVVANAGRVASSQDAPLLKAVEVRSAEDGQLVRGILAGEAWAAAALYDALVPSIRHALRRVLHEPACDLEDAVQSVLEDVVRSLVKGRYSGACSLKNWATLIASRVAIDRLRAKIRERRVFSREDSADALGLEQAPPTDRLVEARHRVKLVQQALAEMRPEYSIALVQHDVMGHGMSEVAALNGISATAAQSRVFRGRRELLERLQKREGKLR